VTRYRASFPIDAQSPEQALQLAVDAMRPRAAPTRDGKPPHITIVTEPAVQPDPGVMRWSWTGADREVRGREVTIAYEGGGAGWPRRARGLVAIFRESGEPQVETVSLAPGRMAELVRALALFPVDLMDRMAMEDMRRRQGEGGTLTLDGFGDIPTLTGGDGERE
jgi:hypothetical protein